MKDIHEYERLIDTYSANKEKEEALLATLMTELAEKTKPLLNDQSKLEKELIMLRKNVDEAKATYDIAQSKLELYMSVKKAEKEKLDSLRESVEKNASIIQERQKQLTLFKTQIPATERSLKQAQDEMDEAKAHETKTTAALKKLRITLEEKQSVMQTSKSQNRILDALMGC